MSATPRSSRDKSNTSSVKDLNDSQSSEILNANNDSKLASRSIISNSSNTPIYLSPRKSQSYSKSNPIFELASINKLTKQYSSSKDIIRTSNFNEEYKDSILETFEFLDKSPQKTKILSPIQKASSSSSIVNNINNPSNDSESLKINKQSRLIDESIGNKPQNNNQNPITKIRNWENEPTKNFAFETKESKLDKPQMINYILPNLNEKEESSNITTKYSPQRLKINQFPSPTKNIEEKKLDNQNNFNNSSNYDIGSDFLPLPSYQSIPTNQARQSSQISQSSQTSQNPKLLPEDQFFKLTDEEKYKTYLNIMNMNPTQTIIMESTTNSLPNDNIKKIIPSVKNESLEESKKLLKKSDYENRILKQDLEILKMRLVEREKELEKLKNFLWRYIDNPFDNPFIDPSTSSKC